MNRRISKELTLRIVGIAGATALLVGLVADLGGTVPMVVAACFGAVAIGLVGASATTRADITVAEAMVVILLPLTAFLGATVVEREDRAVGPSAPHAPRQGERTYGFVIFAGEDDPDPDAPLSFEDPDAAYERIEPDADAYPAPEGRRFIGEHVEVVCAIDPATDELGGDRWFRLTNGNFMHGAVIKAIPHTDEPRPPRCPR